MQTIWKRIEDWLSIHAPELGHLLQPGASEADIRQAEALVQVTFPEDINASYRIHNGCAQSHQSNFILQFHTLLSLTEMVDTWRALAPPPAEQYPDEPTDLDPAFEEPFEEENWRGLVTAEYDGAVTPEEGYDRQLIPCAQSLDGGVLCFDTDTLHQTDGMIFDYSPESGISFAAANWRDLLARFADDLESGKYQVERGPILTYLRFIEPE